ncbi:MAG: hypothetical protein ACI9P3_003171 [Bradyrhizobium sp.]|jgi:hypothetical protein
MFRYELIFKTRANSTRADFAAKSIGFQQHRIGLMARRRDRRPIF